MLNKNKMTHEVTFIGLWVLLVMFLSFYFHFEDRSDVVRFINRFIAFLNGISRYCLACEYIKFESPIDLKITF